MAILLNLVKSVSSANLTIMLLSYRGLQSYVYSEYNKGLNTQPCGAPVLITSGDETRFPILTVCDLSL